jgi:uncharacterized radical SAM superfamily protein
MTGEACAYNCGHCGGHYLKGMADVSDPAALLELALKLEAGGGLGFLLSGGCAPGGSVDFSAHLDALAEVRTRTGLLVNAHTGLMDAGDAAALCDAGVDVVSVDVVGSGDVVRDVYGFEAGPDDYSATLKALAAAGDWSVVPHICLGLEGTGGAAAASDGEMRALRLVADAPRVDALVVISFIPTVGTAMETRDPVAPAVLAEFIRRAKEALDVPVVLGCMRPRAGAREEERLALDAGADGVVLPSRDTLAYVRKMGWDVREHQGCCALVPTLLR